MVIEPYAQFLGSCHFWLTELDPAIAEVRGAWQWFDKSQLQLRYPNGLPMILIKAIDAYAAGRSHGEKKYMDDLKKKTKKK